MIKMSIKFSMAAQETLTKEQMQHYNDKIKDALSRSTQYKKAEVTTLGDAYYRKGFMKSGKVIPLTTMHIVRFNKR